MVLTKRSAASGDENDWSMATTVRVISLCACVRWWLAHGLRVSLAFCFLGTLYLPGAWYSKRFNVEGLEGLGDPLFSAGFVIPPSSKLEKTAKKSFT